LAIESTKETGWLPVHELAEAVDVYFANRWQHGDKPRAGALGIPASTKPVGAVVITNRPMDMPFVRPTESPTSNNKPINVKAGSRNVDFVRRCFICGSQSHLKNECPERSKSAIARPGPKVNACHIEEPENLKAKYTTVSDNFSEPARHTVDAEVQVCVEPCLTDDSDVKDMHITCLQTADVGSVMQQHFVDDYAKLQYVNVKVTDQNKLNFKMMSGLCDTGAEISVIHTSMLNDWELPVVGRIKLRGIVGSPVSADLVKLNVTLADSKRDGDEYVSIICAVCSEANDDLVLTGKVVDNLFKLQSQVTSVNIDLLSENDNDEDNDDHDDSDHELRTATDMLSENREADVCRNANMSNDNVSFDNNVNIVNGATDTRGTSRAQCSADAETLRQEQLDDETLKGWWSLAKRGKGGFFMNNGLLYRMEKILGQSFSQLVLPKSRRPQVLEMAHDTFGGHLGEKRTRERIRLSFTWPTLISDCKKYCQTCVACQKRARKTFRDRVPITPIPRAEAPFNHWFMDCLGPIVNYPCEYNYCLVLCDSATRWPAAFPLRSLTAKHVCEALLQLWMITGIPATISSDNATNFTSKLNHEFLKRMGCSPRFNTPGHPQSSGLVERMVGTLKNMINKVAQDHPKLWHKYLAYILWALRECPSELTGVPPWVLVFGHLPRGPLSVLKETWSGEVDLPLDLGKNVTEFMRDLRNKLCVAQDYARSHSDRAQARYASHYNLRSKDKQFVLGEQVLLLTPNTTASKVYSQWKGPATVVEVKSPYSYLVELDGARHHVHANKLRKFHVRVDEVIFEPVFDEEVNGYTLEVGTCAIIYDSDKDFGSVAVVDPPLKDPDKRSEPLPSQKIDPEKLNHLSEQQRRELLAVLDQFPDCFSDTPGFCDLAEHEIPVTGEFKPKRLRAYKVPERLKPEVDRQIHELLSLGFIRPSKSQMASPLVCVLKGKDGKDGVRLAVDYRYVNKYTVGDAYPIPDYSDIVQRMGRSSWISTFDAKSAFWQTKVREDHQWLTAFVCDEGLFEWVRTPFGMKSSSATCVRAIQQILRPLKQFTDSYVDDMTVFSDQWRCHLHHLTEFLKRIRECGLTLNIKKCNFAQNNVKFCGQIVGSGQRRADPEKVAVVRNIKVPETKTQVRRLLGFFSWFREYIPGFATYAKPLTDLTAKRVPNKIPWGQAQQEAFEKLKELLCQATVNPLNIVDFAKPYNIHVDTSNYMVGAVVSQSDENGGEKPIAFASKKLNSTQQGWSTIEKESYAAMWALQKYRNWIFGAEVVVHSDHNPITYLTEASPKSAKLMRWALAIQEFNVKFQYKAGKHNTAADFLSRMDPAEDGEA